MSELVARVGAIMQGVEGVAEVLDNAFDKPAQDPAVVVEVTAEQPSGPQELPIIALPLGQKIAIGFHVAVGRNKGEAAIARDLALDLSRRGRVALANNPNLDGLCQDTLLGPTRVYYASWHGGDYVVAQMDLAALFEEELS